VGQRALAVKPDESFWQRFLAIYRFRRQFGRESWWASFWVQSGQPGAIDQAITAFAHGHLTGGGRPYTATAVQKMLRGGERRSVGVL
jgi:hypothetical protein